MRSLQNSGEDRLSRYRNNKIRQARLNAARQRLREQEREAMKLLPLAELEALGAYEGNEELDSFDETNR